LERYGQMVFCIPMWLVYLLLVFILVISMIACMIICSADSCFSFKKRGWGAYLWTTMLGLLSLLV
jgi:hypothetical protein